MASLESWIIIRSHSSLGQTASEKICTLLLPREGCHESFQLAELSAALEGYHLMCLLWFLLSLVIQLYSFCDVLTDPSPPPSLQLVSIISSIVVFITLVGLTGLFTFLPIVSASVVRCHSALCHGNAAAVL